MQCCARCGREVYSAEQKIACNKVWHAFCFSCYKCGKLLDNCSVNSFEGEIFCGTCYKYITGACHSCGSSGKVCITACNPHSPCDSWERLGQCNNCCTENIQLGQCNNCCTENIEPCLNPKACGPCIGEVQCCKATYSLQPCLDECALATLMSRCGAPSPGCCSSRQYGSAGHCSRSPCSVSIPREVVNYYNRNHDDPCDGCCQSTCNQPAGYCPSCDLPCATLECSPPKSCYPPSSSCPPPKYCPPARYCPPAKCDPSAKCCVSTKCSPTADCLPQFKCSSCPKYYAPARCSPPHKRCSSAKSCPPPRNCVPSKCSPNIKYCTLKPVCPSHPCSSFDPCPPCLSDPCCGQHRPCSGKTVCYPPVKNCEPHPEEIIYFHPGSSVQPKCPTAAPTPCELECRRRTALYCNSPYCRRCGHKVYAAEKVQIAGNIFHSCCFSCYCCNKPLDVSNAFESQGEIFCKTCYCKCFGIQGYGNYS